MKTKINKVGSNMTELHNTKGIFLFSYDTVVAAQVGDYWDCVRTEKKWSATTSKHINKWLDGRAAKFIPQEELETLV